MKNRRDFLKIAGSFTALSAINSIPFTAFAGEDIIKLTILHTNDVHSRIEPFPMDGSKYQGLGGIARRAQLISDIRKREENVLLLDAGDMVQGTPYYNMYKGKLELELMSKLKYDAGTFGNHEFDNGIEGLAYMMQYANFPFLTANYDFDNTILNGRTKDYIIIKKQDLRIGIFGIGIELTGMVDPKLCRNVVYRNPIKVANEIAGILANDHKCDFVICLSHLGYKYQADKVSDIVLASQTRNIDLILGGHTHTFMAAPDYIKNLDGNITTVNQVGFAGINLGRIDYYFDVHSGKRKLKAAKVYTVTNNG